MNVGVFWITVLGLFVGFPRDWMLNNYGQKHYKTRKL